MSVYLSTYEGPKRQLVIAFDIGNVHSCVSYAVLDPGKTPKIQTVSRWSGQEVGDSKIATVIYYDSEGRMIAAGDETPDLDGDDDEDWDATELYKVEGFKLLLNPPTTNKNTLRASALPSLPPEKTIEKVYADFYGYLFHQTRRYMIETRTSIGALVWDSVSDDIAFIITHPSDWKEAQRSVLRTALMLAGLVPDTPDGREGIKFVTEDEASFHFCASAGILGEEIELGTNAMIIHAGDESVDFSTYSFDNVAPIELNGLVEPISIAKGSYLVTQRLRKFLEGKLAGSKFGDASYIDTMTAQFKRVVQKRFKGSGDSWLRFGNVLDGADGKLGIRNGQIKLTNEEISSCFDPSVREIIATIEDQKRLSGCSFPVYILTGSFASNEYLYHKLKLYVESVCDQTLYRPDANISRVVTQGAVSFYIDQYALPRAIIAKHTYGSRCAYVYDHKQPDHVQRVDKVGRPSRNGLQMLDHGFQPMLFKGTRVREEVEFEYPFYAASRSGTNRIECEIICYSGDRSPAWIDEDPENFATLTKIIIEASRIPRVAQRGLSSDYYHQNYTVVLSFGLTKIKAYLTWKEKQGVKHESQVHVIPESPITTSKSTVVAWKDLARAWHTRPSG